MDSTEFKQASDGMPFVFNGRTFLKFNGWPLPVTQLRQAGINMTEKYLNSPIPISFGDTNSISSNNVEFDLPKILNAFVTEDRNRVNLKTECENSDSKFAMVKREVLNLRSEFKTQAVDIQNLQTEVIKLNGENQKLELSTLQAEERSCSAESRCATLEAQLQTKDLQLEAKNQEIARIQAEAAQSPSLRPPSVCSLTLCLKLFIINVWWVSEIPNSQGVPAYFTDVRGLAPVPPSYPEIVIKSA